MKLLIVSHPCVTPVNQHLYAEVERLTGWALTIAGPSNWTDDYGTRRSLERDPRFEGALVPIPVWPSGHIPLHMYGSTFQSLLRALRPDAIYVHNEPYAASTAQVMLAARLSGQSPALGFYSAQNIVKRYPPPFRWTEQWVYGASTFAFPCSDTVRDTLRQKGYAHEAALLPLGIDPGLYRPRADDAALRARLAGDADVLLGYLGRITREKGLFTLLDALARLPAALRWRLAIVGTGEAEDDLREQAAGLGLADRIEWVGYVPHPEAPRYLSAFDALVLPSETQPNWKEQFGRVVVEALASETPVVGTDSGEIPHLLRRTGGGLVVPERAPAALADALAELAVRPDRRATLARRGAEYVRTHLTHAALAHTFASTVERAVHAPAAARPHS